MSLGLKRNTPESVIKIVYKDSRKRMKHINLLLRGKITMICGNSGTGKTLLVSTLGDIKENKDDLDGLKSNIDLNSLEIIPTDTKFEGSTSDGKSALQKYIEERRGKIIIIDEADSRIESDNSIRNYIERDTDSLYVLIYRTTDIKDIGITPANIATLQNKDNTISLNYAYDAGGW